MRWNGPPRRSTSGSLNATHYLSTSLSEHPILACGRLQRPRLQANASSTLPFETNNLHVVVLLQIVLSLIMEDRFLIPHFVATGPARYGSRTLYARPRRPPAKILSPIIRPSSRMRSGWCRHSRSTNKAQEPRRRVHRRHRLSSQPRLGVGRARRRSPLLLAVTQLGTESCLVPSRSGLCFHSSDCPPTGPAP